MEIGEIAKTHFLNTTKEQYAEIKDTTIEYIQNSSQVKQDNKKIQEEQLLNAIEKANVKFESKNNELSFSVHEKTKQIMVKVINKETKEIVKEIPPEKILDMIANMMETAGLFVDERR